MFILNKETNIVYPVLVVLRYGRLAACRYLIGSKEYRRPFSHITNFDTIYENTTTYIREGFDLMAFSRMCHSLFIDLESILGYEFFAFILQDDFDEGTRWELIKETTNESMLPFTQEV